MFFYVKACAYQMDQGNCFGYSEVWFFNTKSGQCEMFIYGLCGGNPNRFGSKRECERECGMYMNPMPGSEKKKGEEEDSKKESDTKKML